MLSFLSYSFTTPCHSQRRKKSTISILCYQLNNQFSSRVNSLQRSLLQLSRKGVSNWCEITPWRERESQKYVPAKKRVFQPRKIKIMPYSDNMYSMNDDSDGEEDYASELSPSDGQFPTSSSNATPHVPNILIPDPTLERTEAEREGDSKAREAEQEALLIRSRNDNTTTDTDFGYDPSESSSQLRQTPAAAATTTPAHASLPHHHSHEVTYTQSSAAQAPARTGPGRAWSPSVYSEAPPAYTPSPVSPHTAASGSGTATNNTNNTTSTPTPTTATTVLNQQGQSSRNYNTFGGTNRVMGVPEFEAEGLLGHQHQPESMGGPPDEEAGDNSSNNTPAWSRRVGRRLPGWFGWKYGLLALVVLVLSAATLGGVFSSSPRRGGGSHGDDVSSPALLFSILST